MPDNQEYGTGRAFYGEETEWAVPGAWDTTWIHWELHLVYMMEIWIKVAEMACSCEELCMKVENLGTYFEDKEIITITEANEH